MSASFQTLVKRSKPGGFSAEGIPKTSILYRFEAANSGTSLIASPLAILYNDSDVGFNKNHLITTAFHKVESRKRV